MCHRRRSDFNLAKEDRKKKCKSFCSNRRIVLLPSVKIPALDNETRFFFRIIFFFSAFSKRIIDASIWEWFIWGEQRKYLANEFNNGLV